MKILVVDDNLELLSNICSLLKRNEFEVWPASSAKRALGMAYHKVPDFIIFDMLMPEMDGYEFCEMLQLNPVTCNIPVALMVTDFNSVDEKMSKSSGVIDIFEKPIVEKEFILKIDAIHKLINSRKNLKIKKNINYNNH
jgi:CheY-like chemotaxis protein